MHLHWEKSSNTAGDCCIRSLSWMGRVPDEIPQDEGWKLNRAHYYQEGWLSTANLRGVVGVTYTSSNCAEASDVPEPPFRTNYNLRGHRSEVTLVKWNEPYQKLASCDTSGIIFVWIKYEGRWSIELINDRNTPVICFSWSHDGRMALICYQDGFVLVGSVAGQRYWSTLLPAADTQEMITCGTWTPDDQQVYLGTSQGTIVVMDILGNTVARVALRADAGIVDLAWNCERFSMEEQDEQHNHLHHQQNRSSNNSGNALRSSHGKKRPDGSPYTLAVGFQGGDVLLMRGYDDCIPQVVRTGFQSYVIDWMNSGAVLAAAGNMRELTAGMRPKNAVRFYTDGGSLIYTSMVPSDSSPVSAVTWGHNDKRLFVATGNQVHVGWVSSQVASLQLLSRLRIHRTLKESSNVQLLPLPCRMQNLIGMLFTQTIRSRVPEPHTIREFAIRTHPENARLHCTMIRHEESTNANSNSSSSSAANADANMGVTYTLYLEHLGGFLPLLKGKKVSKIRPEFVIYDPSLNANQTTQWTHLPQNHPGRRLCFTNFALELSENEADLEDEPSNSPRNQRRRRHFRQLQARTAITEGGAAVAVATEYINVLPEEERLAEVTSNFWGTKFNILSSNLELMPPTLGEVVYKASLLHLQPRQMRLEITDMKNEGNDDDADEDDDVDGLFAPEFAGCADSDEDDDNFVSEKTSGSGVMMRRDILKASVPQQDAVVAAAATTAPIAPLPSRLSFCLPTSPAAAARTAATNEAAICDDFGSHAKTKVEFESPAKHKIRETADVPLVDISPLTRKQSPLRKSPVKTVVGQALAKAGEAPPPIPEMELKAEGSTSSPSPSKRRLRMSVSCDNYLSDAKFALSRRDSVGSGSPHSSKGSPRRWAAKADEISAGQPPSSVLATTAVAADGGEVVSVLTVQGEKERTLSGEAATISPAICNSGSVNELDVIVDLLGVPSDLLTQRDLNRRLFLLNEKKREEDERRKMMPDCNRKRSRSPMLEELGKSKSCEETPGMVRRRRRRQAAKNTDVEMKRKSVYCKDFCRGRTEAKACQNCEDINDSELNKEIFDLPWRQQNSNGTDGDTEDEVPKNGERVRSEAERSVSGRQQLIEETEGIEQEHNRLGPIRENIPVGEQVNKGRNSRSQHRKKFDSVRSLLEKARSMLLLSKSLKKGDRDCDSRPPRVTRMDTSENANAFTAQAQSSPNTPLMKRKERGRNRSFSPVKAILNSPLLRRRNKHRSRNSTDSSDDELQHRQTAPRPSGSPQRSSDEDGGAAHEPAAADGGAGNCYQNLETFQKHQLKQKLRKLTTTSQDNPSDAAPAASCLARPTMTPPAAPRHRHPSPQPSSTPLFLSPFLPRKRLFNTPNLRRKFEFPASRSRSREREDQQGAHHPTAPPPVKARGRWGRRPRKKLVLHNKSPMWNAASQVYQLDFGGRVTQESAKNFQIEYKDKTVMQFGRIDNNAYTLDFQYPFTAVQAFGVALANVTQRLK